MVVRVSEFEVEMPVTDRHFTRIDTLDIKIQICKKLGSQKAQKYLEILNRFFGHKIGKMEFDKLCVAVIGRENIGLHNRLIKSILSNALLSKTPPPKENKDGERRSSEKVANEYQRSCLQSLCRDVFPHSPRKGRTPGLRERKGKDRPSPLGPHGKANAVRDNMDLGQKTLEKQSPTELLSLGSRPVEVISVEEDGEEVDQAAINPGIYSRSPIRPPLGISWNGKGNQKVLNSLTSEVHVKTCQKNGELPDTSCLTKLLEKRLEKEGLKVSVDCVNLLNNGLDTFLKRLIKPSLELASSRVGNKGQNQMNGTMLDFRTTMELNPRILGVEWPMQLEKVCLRESESCE